MKSRYPYLIAVVAAVGILSAGCMKDNRMEICIDFQSHAGQMQLDSLKHALIGQDGVENVAIDPDYDRITVTYDRFQTSDKKILSIISDVGLTPSAITKTSSGKD